MEKIRQNFSASLDKFLEPADDILIVALAAVLALLAQIYGILP